MSKLITAVFATVLVGFALIQVLPFGRSHANPPVRTEPNWDSPQTRELADRACFDCHSNQTRWPWYSSVAPVSWLVQRDVDAGRRKLNFSEWDRPQKEAKEAAETVREGKMPIRTYLLLHPEATLSAAERRALADGLAATLGGEGKGDEEDKREDEREDD